MVTSCENNSYSKNLEILRLLQICDSNFPIGSFNHSYGMETYLRNNEIIDTKSFKKWLSAYLNYQFIYSDGLAIRMLYDKFHDNINDILEIDNLLMAQSVAKETRQAGKLIAGRMLKIFFELYDINILREYEEKIIIGEAYGHPALVFALLAKSLGMTEKDAIIYYMYSTISTMIQNAVRAIPIGQKDGQILVKEFSENFDSIYDLIKECRYDSFGANTPGLELSQINHETLVFRLFMS